MSARSPRSTRPHPLLLAWRAADWRYLMLFVIAVFVPTSLLLMPVASFFGSFFDTSPRAVELMGTLASGPFVEIMRQIGEPSAAAIGPGLRASLLVAALFAPALAAAAVALARTSPTRGALPLRALLGAIGELYPRMVRTAVVSLLPLGVAAAIIGATMHFADQAKERAVLESSASRLTVITTVVAVLLVWLANVTVDAGRAHFAVEPERRSALLAWWSGLKLTARKPLAVIGLSLVTTLVGVGLAAVLTAIRLRVPQSGSASIAVTFVVAQIAVLPLAWSRAARMIGLADLIRGQAG
jgi:hypothetical protein